MRAAPLGDAAARPAPLASGVSCSLVTGGSSTSSGLQSQIYMLECQVPAIFISAAREVLRLDTTKRVSSTLHSRQSPQHSHIAPCPRKLGENQSA